MMSWKAHLERIYFDLKSPISFSGPTKIYNYLKKEGKYKVSLYATRQWLQDIDAYSLQRPLRYKFKTRRVISQGIDALWDADLADDQQKTHQSSKLLQVTFQTKVSSTFCYVKASIPTILHHHQQYLTKRLYPSNARFTTNCLTPT